MEIMFFYPLNKDKYSLVQFLARLQYTQLPLLTTKWNLDWEIIKQVFALGFLAASLENQKKKKQSIYY